MSAILSIQEVVTVLNMKGILFKNQKGHTLKSDQGKVCYFYIRLFIEAENPKDSIISSQIFTKFGTK